MAHFGPAFDRSRQDETSRRLVDTRGLKETVWERVRSLVERLKQTSASWVSRSDAS